MKLYEYANEIQIGMEPVGEETVEQFVVDSRLVDVTYTATRVSHIQPQQQLQQHSQQLVATPSTTNTNSLFYSIEFQWQLLAIYSQNSNRLDAKAITTLATTNDNPLFN